MIISLYKALTNHTQITLPHIRMPKEITINPLSFVSIPINMRFGETNQTLASGTCFFYKRNSKYYIITNWHNVTGKNPITKEQTGKHGGIPDILDFTLLIHKQPFIKWSNFTINLYDQDKKPEWLVHPKFKEKVDVIALEVEFNKDFKGIIKPINELDFSEFELKVSDDIYILGFPYKLGGGGQFPIWKKGSVATEPELDYDGLPKMFVDTASRPGMSGSPVIFKRNGIHGIKNGKINLDSLIGEIQGFVGIYSGRILGKSELEAQLGIVWKKSVINEIIDGNMKDTYNVW